jgi:hypothetical protein
MSLSNMADFCMLYVLYDVIPQNGDCAYFGFPEQKSIIKTQRRYRAQYGKAPPSDNAIRRWLKHLQETGNVQHRRAAERPSTSQEDVDQIQEAWTSYVPGKTGMLKLVSILHY